MTVTKNDKDDGVLLSLDHEAGTSFWKWDKVLLLSIVVTGVLLRLAFLNQNMRFDESQTFNLYVSQAPRELFHYTQLNNHMLHSLIVWLTTLVAGSEPWALRLPAFLFGILTIPLTFQLCRVLNPGSGGFLAAMGTAVFPFLILFSTNARGYTLLTCLVLVLAMSIIKFVRDPDSVSNLRISMLIALGLWTNPSMLYPTAGLLFWLFLELYAKQHSVKYVTLRFLIPVLIQIYVLTLLFYAPALMREGGFDDVFNNPVTASLSLDEFSTGAVPHIKKVFRHICRDIPAFWLYIGFAFFALGSVHMLRQRRTSGATFLISMILGIGLLFLAKRSFPFTRNWMFLIPIVLIHVDIGFMWMLQRLPQRLQWIGLIMILITCVTLGHDLVKRDRISSYNDTGRFPEVLEVAEFLASVVTEDDVIVVKIPYNEPLTYYLGKRQLDVPSKRQQRDGKRNFVIFREDKKRKRRMPQLQPIFKSGATTVFLDSPDNGKAEVNKAAADFAQAADSVSGDALAVDVVGQKTVNIGG